MVVAEKMMTRLWKSAVAVVDIVDYEDERVDDVDDDLVPSQPPCSISRYWGRRDVMMMMLPPEVQLQMVLGFRL